ncbi:VOC family protein [Streptodolium elevatio]
MPTPSVSRVRGYSHIGIGVDDLDAARAFYIGLLGFEELPRPDLGPGMWLRIGDLQLHFVGTDDMPTPGGGLPGPAGSAYTDRRPCRRRTGRRPRPLMDP